MEKQPNSLGKAIYTAQDNAKLDETVKNLLSQKPILAYILKYAVREFFEYDIKDIPDMIDQVHVSKIAVEPGATNDVITGEAQESTIPGEGTIKYDIRFIATLPKGEKPSEYNLIINVEAQTNPYRDYWIETRGIAYCARQISEQIGRNVTHSHYNDLQKVYSIWICMKCRKEDANTISEYAITQVNHVGEYKKHPRIDLMGVIVIRLPEDDEWEQAENKATKLTKMLATLLSNRIAPKEKIETLENEYGIEATEEIVEEVNNMCNYSSAVENDKARKMAIKMISNGEPDSKITLYTELTETAVKELREELKKKDPVMA